jgi:ABC-2 type transport system permease protein
MIPNIIVFYFLGGIFGEKAATLRTYFMILPYVFIIFIPGLTMGAWSKEKNTGTIELLFTLPVGEFNVLLGKFFAALSLISIALLSTLSTPILTSFLLGNFDWGQILTQYIGAILLAGCGISVTFFLSSLTKELIDSFLLGSSLLFILTITGFISRKMESFYGIKIFLNNISFWSHFLNFGKGVIDSRDVFFYLGIIIICFYLNLRALESKRWS